VRYALPADVPLFALLLELAQRTGRDAHRLRVIGGLAMGCWHQAQNSQPSTTEDIDCAFPSSDWSTEAEARPRILALVHALEDLGLEQASGPKARASRTARFTWRRPDELARVELICGPVAFGKASRRKPAWRLLELESGRIIYASRLEWLDLVEDWVPVELELGTQRAALEIPDIKGLMLLKLKAVVDKLQRCDEEQRPHWLAHEVSRLERHAGDFLTLFAWAQRTPSTLPAFRKARLANPTVQAATNGLARRVLLPPPTAELQPIYDRLRSIATLL